MGPVVMILLIVGNAAFFSWSAYRRLRQLSIGSAHPGFALEPEAIMERMKNVAVYAAGQKKMPYQKYELAGIAHILIFLGFNVLLLRTLILWGRGFDPGFDFWGLLGRGTLLGEGYGLAKDLVALGVIAGSLVFVYYRLVAREQRMTLGVEGLVILGIIITMMLADILYDAATFALEAHAMGRPHQFHLFEPVGSSAAFALEGIGDGTLKILQHAGFWTHSSLVLFFGNLLPYSKHFHIITSLPNVFGADLTPPGKLPTVTDLEGRVEREEPVGIAKLEDLSWKHILDLYTCTECGRCSDNCPAFTTGKKLSPKHLTLALRNHVYDTEQAMFGGQDGVVAPNAKAPISKHPDEKEELHIQPPPPKDAYFESSTPVALVPNIIDPEVLWACTTCRACEEQCPVLISYVDKIVGMRRDLVMIKAEFPPDLERAFRGMENNGNPWNYSRMDRASWSDGLDVPTIADKPDAEVLYWVGCAASYDDRAKKIARATAQLLKQAGVDFAILATDESCTGDPARRAGNEFLFQMLAQSVVETLNGANADKKTIITTCPHCFNTLANEYPDFGGKYDVVHHSDFLNGLLARRKLRPKNPVKGRVVYHDACYLGRYNDVYESPRAILRAIPGIELVEVPMWNRNRGLCCGAGGAQMFMEEMHGKERVNSKRSLQLIDTGAKTIATGCPFCATMIGDGLKAHEEKAEGVAQLDIAELLAQSVGVA